MAGVGALVGALLGGLTNNPALDPVTVEQLFEQIPVGGNDEPSTRRLQSGPAGHGFRAPSRNGSPPARVQLSSYSAAVERASDELTALSDDLLGDRVPLPEPQAAHGCARRFGHDFAGQLGQITLATERT